MAKVKTAVIVGSNRRGSINGKLLTHLNVADELGAFGENSASIRKRVADRLDWLGAKLGAKLDPQANMSGETRISSPDSRIGLYVVPTDEELMIARHTLALVAAAR